MEVLILKLNATGDVVRNTPLLRRLDAEVTWVTAAMNLPLLTGVRPRMRSLSWEQRDIALDRSYDLVLNLEDDAEVAAFARSLSVSAVWRLSDQGRPSCRYTDDCTRLVRHEPHQCPRPR